MRDGTCARGGAQPGILGGHVGPSAAVAARAPCAMSWEPAFAAAPPAPWRALNRRPAAGSSAATPRCCGSRGPAARAGAAPGAGRGAGGVSCGSNASSKPVRSGRPASTTGWAQAGHCVSVDGSSGWPQPRQGQDISTAPPRGDMPAAADCTVSACARRGRSSRRRGVSQWLQRSAPASIDGAPHCRHSRLRPSAASVARSCGSSSRSSPRSASSAAWLARWPWPCGHSSPGKRPKRVRLWTIFKAWAQSGQRRASARLAATACRSPRIARSNCSQPRPASCTDSSASNHTW